MKKRIIGLALIIGVLLSLSASAWADKTYYELKLVGADYRKFFNINDRQDEEVNIGIQVLISGLSAGTQPTGMVEADTIKLTITQSPSDAATSPIRDLAFAIGGTATPEQGTSTYTVKLNGSQQMIGILTGYIQAAGTITVEGILYNGSSAISSTNLTATIETSVEEGEDVCDSPVRGGDSSAILDKTGADPAADNENWDGLDPLFGTGNGDEVKPKVTTSKVVFASNSTAKSLTAGKADSFNVTVEGSDPQVDVYISGTDANKLWPNDISKDDAKKVNIRLTRANILKYKIPFRVTAITSKDKTTGSGKNVKTIREVTLTIAYNGANVSYKGFPISVSVDNAATATSGTATKPSVRKPVAKSFKVDITSGRATPQWVTKNRIVGEKLKDPATGKITKNAQETSLALADSSKNTANVTYWVSADAPYTITTKGDTLGTKYGISADTVQPVINKYGEVVTQGYVTFKGQFPESITKDSKGDYKEAKSAFTMDAAGNVKKTSFKATIIGKTPPVFDTKKKDASGFLTGIKTAEAGKVPSVKFTAKGSKTIKYSISAEDLGKLNAVNLSFDTAKGQVVASKDVAKKQAMDSLPTLNSTGDALESIDITVSADNGAGTDSIKAWVGITGAKPALTKNSQKLTIAKDAAEGTVFILSADAGKIKNVSADNKNNNITYKLTDAKQEKVNGKETGRGEDSAALEDLGLELLSYEDFDTESQDTHRNYAVIRVMDGGIQKAASKGQKINLTLDNFGATNKGTVTIYINDPAPVIEVTSPDPFSKFEVQAISKDKVEAKVELGITSATQSTDGAKIGWKAGKLTGTAPSGLKVAVDKDKADPNNTNKQILTLTVPKNCTSYTGSVDITATNGNDKQFGTITIGIAVTGVANTRVRNGKAAPADEAELDEEIDADENAEPEADEIDAEDDAEVEEEAVIFGAPRTAAQLTAGQNAFLAEKGYKVIAVLPEVTAKVDGQQEFEVELDEDAPEGAKLIWLAFPQNAEETDDDKIADFYDADGTEIEEVPAGKVIIAEPWLRAGVKYQPVIAVEE